MQATLPIRHLIAVCASAMLLTATAARADIQTTQLEVVVGNHADPYTTDYAKPFFETLLAERSGGKVTARAIPYTELGLSGFEMMNLLKLGTYDISYAVPGYIAGDSPLAEGIELPGVVDNIRDAFRAFVAYRPILEREYAAKFNARLIVGYVHPHSQIYCQLSDAEAATFSLATLKGKKVRVHSTSFSDFAEGIGMVPVTMPFGDVVPALERGALDCGMTSPNAAYGFKWGQVTNTVVDVPVVYSTQFLVMNLDTWNGLNADTQKFLNAQFKDLEARMAHYAPTFDKVSVECLLDGPCPYGEPAGMRRYTLNGEDSAALKRAVEEIMLTRWLSRCGKGCAGQWNAALADITGITLNTD